MMDCCNWSLPWGGTNQQEPFLFVVDPAGTICAYGSKTKQSETYVVVNFPRVSTNHISPYTITVAINDNGSVFPTDSKQLIPNKPVCSLFDTIWMLTKLIVTNKSKPFQIILGSLLISWAWGRTKRVEKKCHTICLSKLRYTVWCQVRNNQNPPNFHIN